MSTLRGKIIKILNERQLILDLGETTEVKVGRKFVIYEEGPEVRDPETKSSLGNIEIIKGEIEVESVQENFSIAHVIPRIVGQKYVKTSNQPDLLSSLSASLLSYLPREGYFEDITELPKLDAPKTPIKIEEPTVPLIKVGDFVRAKAAN